MAESLLHAVPKILPKLDPDFRPPYLGHRQFVRAAKLSGRSQALLIAVERENKQVARYDTICFAPGVPGSKDNYRYAERIIKFLLWQRGGWKITLFAPDDVVAQIKKEYSPGGSRAFDAEFMAKVYDAKSFVVQGCAKAKAMPQAHELSKPVGRHLEGCRIGFDAGGSDRKVAAVINGKEVFSIETVWEPKIKSDPQYHIDGVMDSLRQAAAKMPRVDAIGISSAGVYVDNQARVASLFRKVPEPQFSQKIKNIYLDAAKAMGNVPIEVANDGDVTALAGAMSLNDQPVLGIAMGTSQAVGYVDKKGHVTGWLNELAFAPVDYQDGAAHDHEWSGDFGTGVNHFSQDAVIRLAPKVGMTLDAALSPGAKLKEVQKLMKQGDDRARAIFETIGVYLGYALLQYADFYDMKHVLILGRVTSGAGGDIILEKARQVLAAEDPAAARRIKVGIPDEKARRVGQAIAAASLPEIKHKVARAKVAPLKKVVKKAAKKAVKKAPQKPAKKAAKKK